MILILTSVITDEEKIRSFLSKCKLRHFKYHAHDTSEPHRGIGAKSLLRVAGRPLDQMSKEIADSNTHTVARRSEYYLCTYICDYQ